MGRWTGRRILLLVRRACYTIEGRYHRLVSPRACMYLLMYVLAPINMAATQLQQTSEKKRGDRAPINPIKGLPSLT